jgi:aryl-alcohol dehydrogenase-like predicted oxidoreductase
MTTTSPTTRPAAAAGTFLLGGDLPIHRLGYGSMRLSGKGIWGPPEDPDEAVRVLRRAVELGVTFIDTADSYGPFDTEEVIRTALHPYREDLVIATKAGLIRPGPDDWRPLGRPEYLRQQAELSLRRLGVDRIDLFQLHRVDPLVPLAEQVGELKLLQAEGKIRHIGLSEVTVEQVEQAREIVEIASIQNLYNFSDRSYEGVLDYAEQAGIAFIPWFPIAAGELAREDSPLLALAGELSASPAQIALAWLLRRSPVVVPIPGTSTVAHLEENVASALLSLSDTQYHALSSPE